MLLAVCALLLPFFSLLRSLLALISPNLSLLFLSAFRSNLRSLFVASSTVADALAAKYHVSKSDILDRDSDNMAVRMALGEAQIVSDTKAYLEEEGVNKAAFEGRSVKGSLVLVLKLSVICLWLLRLLKFYL